MERKNTIKSNILFGRCCLDAGVGTSLHLETHSLVVLLTIGVQTPLCIKMAEINHPLLDKFLPVVKRLGGFDIEHARLRGSS